MSVPFEISDTDDQSKSMESVESIA